MTGDGRMMGRWEMGDEDMEVRWGDGQVIGKLEMMGNRR